MPDAIAKLLAGWFGSAIRGLVTLLVSAMLFLLLASHGRTASMIHDPTLRWPVGLGIIALVGISTYPVEHAWNRRRVIRRLSTLSNDEKRLLECFREGNRTAHFFNWGLAPSLEKDRILEQVGDLPNNVQKTYRLTDIALKIIRKMPTII